VVGKTKQATTKDGGICPIIDNTKNNTGTPRVTFGCLSLYSQRVESQHVKKQMTETD
jgi:hypothetical protein